MKILWVVAAALLTLAGCKSGLGGGCDESSDCKAGLFCAKSGALRGTCTASCAEQTDYCTVRWGDDATCVGGYCADKSSAAGDPCEGRCPPSTTKCVNGTCVPK